MSDKPEFKGCTCTYVGANCQHCRDMTDKLELKPCPFCGGKAQYADGSPDDGEWVECVKCKACSVMMLPLMEGVKGLLTERWNERADLAKPSEWISVETIDKFIGQIRSEEYRANSCYENTKKKYFDGSGDSYKHCAELLTELIKAISPLPSPPDE